MSLFCFFLCGVDVLGLGMGLWLWLWLGNWWGVC